MTDRDIAAGAHGVREATVSASFLFDVLGHLERTGVDMAVSLEVLAREHGLQPSALRDSGTRVPSSQMAEFWRLAVLASGDPDLGLHSAVDFTPGALDIVGYVMLSAPTASDALHRAVRWMDLLNDGYRVVLERSALHTTCTLHPDATRANAQEAEPRQVMEAILMGTVHQLRLLTQRPVSPLQVRFRHAAPHTGVREHQRLFGVTPVFDAEHDLVVLPNAPLDAPLRSANPSLLAVFETHAQEAAQALASTESVTGQVVGELVRQLKGDVPSLASVARALAVSPRHLQRRLAAEDTTFQRLRDEARRELAARHLAQPGATVAQVAWLLGFSEPSAFHRAYKRWTGRPPRAHQHP